MKKIVKEKLLLHICCATCAAYVIEALQKNYEVIAFFYNPNIYPAKEYAIRLNEVKSYCDENSIPLVIEKPDQKNWFELIKGHEKDPEKGERCTICYRMRLEKTADYASKHDFFIYTTDLSISPHKDAVRLNMLGNELGCKYDIKYLSADFKKNDGFKKAMVISRNMCFYRQNYCGCLFSLKARECR
ncbi:MAG: epoxyqueuosine reductase QueH [Patescibacteria group bacterium]|jgi:predicted adenine nucleotide alpha hydrolase (AANH) superfamily ATPase